MDAIEGSTLAVEEGRRLGDHLERDVAAIRWEKLAQDGAKHDWYQNPQTKVSQPVPSHGEIQDRLAAHLIKMLSDDEA